MILARTSACRRHATSCGTNSWNCGRADDRWDRGRQRGLLGATSELIGSARLGSVAQFAAAAGRDARQPRRLQLVPEASCRRSGGGLPLRCARVRAPPRGVRPPVFVVAGKDDSPAGSDPSSVSYAAVVLAAVTRVRDVLGGYPPGPSFLARRVLFAGFARPARSATGSAGSTFPRVSAATRSPWHAGSSRADRLREVAAGDTGRARA